MNGGFHDDELAADLVGETSARLLAAGLDRPARLRSLRLLGVLVTVADADLRVRRPLTELAVEFDLPAREVHAWLAPLLDAGAVRWEGSSLELAAVEPPAAGGIRLHDFLELVDESDRAHARRRRRDVLRPAGALLAAAAVVVLAVLAPTVVRDRSTPAASSRGDEPAVATTTTERRRPASAPATTRPAVPPSTARGAEQVGPVLVPTTTTFVLPCPTGSPLVRVLGTTPTADGRLRVDGLAHNSSPEEVVIRGFTLRTVLGGEVVTAPGTAHDLVVPGYSTVLWDATMPVTDPAGTLVQAVLGDWSWSNPDIPTTCATP